MDVTLRPERAGEWWAVRRMVLAAGLNPMGLGGRRFVVAVDAVERIVGCAQVKPHSDGTRELASLVVRPDRRGQGIASALIRYWQARCGSPLYLTCRADLETLYARYGFRSLLPAECPPYFRRIASLAALVFRLAGRPNRLRVMVWAG
jgi:GNAT superfamily N-acetyltransferase